MILPTKGVAPQLALVTIGAEILRHLTEAKTVSRLWDEFRKARGRGSNVTFDWFVLGLDLLFALGASDFDRGRVRRADQRHEGPPT